MAVFPDKYDYDKVNQLEIVINVVIKYIYFILLQARLPGPLTEELQEELKERKKAKQKRAKERKVVEELKKEEEVEKQKFLQLSDREKVRNQHKYILSITVVNIFIYLFFFHFSVQLLQKNDL